MFDSSSTDWQWGVRLYQRNNFNLENVIAKSNSQYQIYFNIVKNVRGNNLSGINSNGTGSRNGLLLIQNDGVTITNSNFSNNQDEGVLILNSNNNTYFENVTINNNNYGLRYNPSSNWQNNSFKNITTNGNTITGILLQLQSTIDVGAVFDEIQSNDNGQYGIRFQVGYLNPSYNFSNVEIKNNKLAGIWMERARDTIFTNFTISNCSSTTIGCLSMLYSDNIVFTNGIIDNSMNNKAEVNYSRVKDYCHQIGVGLQSCSNLTSIFSCTSAVNCSWNSSTSSCLGTLVGNCNNISVSGCLYTSNLCSQGWLGVFNTTMDNVDYIKEQVENQQIKINRYFNYQAKSQYSNGTAISGANITVVNPIGINIFNLTTDSNGLSSAIKLFGYTNLNGTRYSDGIYNFTSKIPSGNSIEHLYDLADGLTIPDIFSYFLNCPSIGECFIQCSGSINVDTTYNQNLTFVGSGIIWIYSKLTSDTYPKLITKPNGCIVVLNQSGKIQ